MNRKDAAGCSVSGLIDMPKNFIIPEIIEYQIRLTPAVLHSSWRVFLSEK
jgi:hypothetical protein